MKKLLQIQPVDPIITRDGRPFGETPGAVAHSMDELSPSVLAGPFELCWGNCYPIPAQVIIFSDRIYFPS